LPICERWEGEAALFCHLARWKKLAFHSLIQMWLRDFGSMNAFVNYVSVHLGRMKTQTRQTFFSVGGKRGRKGERATPKMHKLRGITGSEKDGRSEQRAAVRWSMGGDMRITGKNL